MIRVAVDAMGGDFAPEEQVKGAMLAIKRYDDIEITLYGKKEEIEKYLTDSTRITIEDCREVIPMDTHDPRGAIRGMKDSSMTRAMMSLVEGKNDCMCTSGPTQALIVGALLVVRRMEGFMRPALVPTIPSLTTDGTLILDCGGNLDIKPEHLVQQAKFAVTYCKEVLHREDPKVGLLNIGTEEGKGREFENECYKLLKESGLNFVGNVETKQILEPPCDILLSDAFTTNMVVKTVEGTAKSIGKILKSNLKRGFFGKIGALLSMKNLNRFKQEINPDNNGGAMVIGVKHPLVKPHGSSTAITFSYGIGKTSDMVRGDVINKVAQLLKEEGEIKNE